MPVLESAQAEFLDFDGAGMSVMEMSHRSKSFDGVIRKAEALIRKGLNASDDYEVLFIQGGASMQFAMVPLNLYIKGQPVDVVNTGVWSKKAIQELEKLAVHKIAASSEAENFSHIPAAENISWDKNASYAYIVSNNTVCGTQWREFPDTGSVPLVADMSSDILSRKIDVSKFGLLFAGAQKNLGPSGVAVVVIRKDLAERSSKNLPTMMRYSTYIKNQSLYNTPPTFTIYMILKVLEWIESEGGVSVIEKRNEQKADLLYQAIDSNPFYYSPVNKKDRSLMNIVFRIRGDRSEELEARFAKDASEAGLSGLKGHRLVGGLRASIYNAQSLEAIKALADFMKDFERKNG